MTHQGKKLTEAQIKLLQFIDRVGADTLFKSLHAAIYKSIGSHLPAANDDEYMAPDQDELQEFLILLDLAVHTHDMAMPPEETGDPSPTSGQKETA